MIHIFFRIKHIRTSKNRNAFKTHRREMCIDSTR